MKRGILLKTSTTAKPEVVPINSYEDMSRAMGGYLETIPMNAGKDIAVYCDEEGKLKNLKLNIIGTMLARNGGLEGDYIVGDMLFCGYDPASGETLGLTDMQISYINFIINISRQKIGMPIVVIPTHD